MARRDSSPVVRLYLASGLQRMPVGQRWQVLEGLVAHAGDAGDHNLPLMYWYAAEPLADQDTARALALAEKAKMPPLLAFMVRRIASSARPQKLALLVEKLVQTDSVDRQEVLLHNLAAGLKGRRRVPMPAGWSAVQGRLEASSNAAVREQARALAVTFGDARALAQLRQLLTSSKDLAARQQALDTLLAAGDRQLAPVLQQLLREPALRGAAIKGLAAYDDPGTPAVLLAAYSSLSTAEKRDALATLASRPAYAQALLDGIAGHKIAASEVSADLVRQLGNLRNPAIDRRIAEVWGVVRATPADRARQIAQLRSKLTAPSTTPPDLGLGRAVFTRTCQQCHTLFGVGGKVGPDITGANRGSLDYLLENVLAPSAVIPREYAASVISLDSGRVITGIVRKETPAALEVQTATETLTIPREEIEEHKQSEVSMMPEGLLQPLTEREVRALFAYLQSPVQVPLRATADNVRDFFNGKDLTGWDGEPGRWRVDNGEIIGKGVGRDKTSTLRSQMTAGDFRLSLKVKRMSQDGKTTLCIRAQVLPDGSIKGVPVVLRGAAAHPEWDEVEIVARGSRVQTSINGQRGSEQEESSIAREGIFALQIEAAEGAEVRFKDLRLEVLPPQRK
jgi:putative heme-binding domain-containing protein